MNKTKKILTAAVSVVMAGSMAVGLTACGGKGGANNLMTKFEGFMNDAWQSALAGYGSESGSSTNQAKLTPSNNNGVLTYTANTTLKTAIGYDKTTTGIKYESTLLENMQGYLGDTGSNFTLYGKQYGSGSLKPAWQTLSENLGITINDQFEGVGTSSQMQTITAKNDGLSTYQVFTASATDINNQGAQGNLLNITDYLEYMPNYKAFLDANPLVRLSLIADKNGSMYMLPYFDGNDDIEKFVLLEKNLVEILLDSGDLSTDTISFKAQAEAKKAKYSAKTIVGTSSSVESFMGTTGSWEIETTNPEALASDRTDNISWGNNASVATITSGTGSTTTVVVNYDDVLEAAKNSSTALGAAIQDAAGKVYNGTSGNIVDLQNFAINETNGEVKGAKLLSILREYIKVAYQTEGGAQFYTTLSDVFNSAYAAWDVDLYVALGRCFTTCGALLTNRGVSLVKGAEELFLLSGRQYTTQRYSDTYSMAGELYGVRGLESRYSPTFAYINSDGGISDARLNTYTWEALDKMNKLAQEGLYNAMTSDNITNGWSSSNDANNKGVQTLSLHDYVQTQTANSGFKASTAKAYNFAPVLTPVSKWDTNDDGTAETIMRFTESWRSVKNTGWCISYAAVKNDPNALAAALKLVDYFFSNDGQILMTYGPQGSANDSGSATDCKAAGNGFWYGNAVTSVSWSDAVSQGIVDTYDDEQYYVTEDYEEEYFCYNNTLYTGSYYKGRQIPTLTKSALAMFSSSALGANSFTNYARYYIGSALNIGNKDQGFEYQCTAACGIVGSDIVNIALVNGTIKHTLQLSPDEAEANNNWWYMIAPTLLPYETSVNNVISVAPYTIITALNSNATTLFQNNSTSGSTNLLTDVMAYGLGSRHYITCLSNNTVLPDTAEGVVAYLNGSFK